MADSKDSAQKIYKFARDAAIDSESLNASNEDHAEREAKLRQALDDLRQRLQAEKAKISKLRHENGASSDLFAQPASDPATRLWQLKCIKRAYEQLAQEPPVLPAHDSPLPELLALRASSRTSAEMRAAIPLAQSDLSDLRDQLNAEQARLHAYNLLQTALRDRVKHLRAEVQEKSTKSPAELLQAELDEQTRQQNGYVDEGDELLRQLTAFINNHLAAMIAAEELGGPPVGDLVGIADEALGAGFTATGKGKQVKTTDPAELEALANEGRRLRLAASKDLRHLIKRLLRTFDNDPESYVTLDKETVATRYLVQAKVAVLDPVDARRIRLVNFTNDGLE